MESGDIEFDSSVEGSESSLSSEGHDKKAAQGEEKEGLIDQLIKKNILAEECHESNPGEHKKHKHNHAPQRKGSSDIHRFNSSKDLSDIAKMFTAEKEWIEKHRKAFHNI